METIAEIFRLFRERGGTRYGGEAVSQLQHALQAASLAQQHAASDTLISAALLHDIGHLIHDLPEDATQKGIDDHHEQLGEQWLTQYFVQAVWEPVKLHVAAKRYLCTVEPSYGEKLSPVSIASLRLQGGLMSSAELREFEAHTFYRESLWLRRWDDLAKVANARTSSIETFRPHLLASLKIPA